MQPPDDAASPSSASATATSPSTASPAAVADTLNDIPTTKADASQSDASQTDAASVSSSTPVADLDLLSSLLQARTLPVYPLPPLSTSAPRLDARLLEYQHNPPPSHNPRLHSTLTPAVELTSSLYPTSQSLLSHMSHADLLRVHLDDLSVLVHALLDAVGSAGAEAALSVLNRVIAKQRAIDEVTDSLCAHQQRQQRIGAVQRDIAQLDARLIHFASSLAAQQLALSSLLTPPNTHSSSPLPARLRPVSVQSLMSYAQRLSAVSFAPSDVTERKGVSNARPPAPLETEMAASVLQLSPDEMSAWMEARRSEETGASDKIEMAEERKEAPPIPTVAEVESARASAAASASGGAERKVAAAATSVRRAPPAAQAAASLLDLDLNPDDESDDGDDDSDDEG